jgi:tetratricopeptide (TPR) repeat protein
LAEQNYLLQQQNLELQRKLIEEKREQRERQIAAAKTKAEESRQRLRRERARTAVRAGGKHFANGNYKSAFERFSDAAQFTDQDAAPHFLMAQALFAQQRFSEAAEKVRSGVKLNPDWLALDFNIRSLYLKSADFDTQLARLAGNLQANPLDQDALFLLGHLLFLDGQRDSAKTILEQASLLEKDDGTIKAYMDRMAKPAEIAIPDEIAVR